MLAGPGIRSRLAQVAEGLNRLATFLMTPMLGIIPMNAGDPLAAWINSLGHTMAQGAFASLSGRFMKSPKRPTSYSFRMDAVGPVGGRIHHTVRISAIVRDPRFIRRRHATQKHKPDAPEGPEVTPWEAPRSFSVSRSRGA